MKIKQRFVQVTGLLLTGTVFLLVLTTGLRAENQDEQKRLQKAIKRVENDLEQLEERKRTVLKQQNNTLSELDRKKTKTAETLIRRKEQIRNLKTALSDEKNKRETLKKKIKQLKQLQSRTKNQIGKLRNRILEIIEREPPGIHTSKIRRILKTKERNDQTQNLKSLLTASILLLRNGVETDVFQSTVIGSDGHKRPAEVLAVGRILVAYRSLEQDRVEIAVRTSDGYRWDNQFSSSVRNQLDHLFERLNNRTASNGDTNQTPSSQKETLLKFPIDPSLKLGTLRKSGTTSILETLQSGGPVMIPLFLIALVALVLILERFWTLWHELRDTSALQNNVLDALRDNQIDQARKLCQSHSGAVSNVLETLVESRNLDDESRQDRIEEAILNEIPRLERFLSVLQVLAAAAPLLGLLGTVTGIISTFNVLSIFGPGNQHLMAGGISEALLTTATGLAIAIPILLCHGYFRGKVDGIIGEMERSAAFLYNRMSSDGSTNAENNSTENTDD